MIRNIALNTAKKRVTITEKDGNVKTLQANTEKEWQLMLYFFKLYANDVSKYIFEDEKSEYKDIIKGRIKAGFYDSLFASLSSLGLGVRENEFDKVLEEQHQKGIEKYGQTIKECPEYDYNWRKIALEELADLLNYLIKMNK